MSLIGEYAEVEIHQNRPGCAFISFPSWAAADRFIAERRRRHKGKLALSATCQAHILDEPHRSLPPGLESARLDGLSDIGETPTALLLLRNIPATVHERALFDALREDLGLDPSRVLLIRSKDVLELPSGIAFAEFKSSELAGHALHYLERTTATTAAAGRQQLAKVKASYVSMGAFEIAPYPYYDSFVSSGGVKLRYSNLDFFISEYPTPSSSSSAHDTENLCDSGVQDQDPESQRQNQLPLVPQNHISNPLLLRQHEPPPPKKRKAQSNMPSSIRQKLQKWQTKHDELTPPPQPTVVSTTVKSYTDRERLNCYLCERHFTSPEKLNLHERASDLHHYNLEYNQPAVQRADRIYNELLLHRHK